MAGLFEEMFPEDKSWLEGAFKDMDEMFNSFECLARYIRRRFPDAISSKSISSLGSFLLEEVDVIFVNRKTQPRRTVCMKFADRLLVVKIPDDRSWSETERDELRDKYHAKYSPVIKESQIRARHCFGSSFPQKRENSLLPDYQSRRIKINSNDIRGI